MQTRTAAARERNAETARAAAVLLRPVLGILLGIAGAAAFAALPNFGTPWGAAPIAATLEHQNVFLIFFHQDAPVALAVAAATVAIWALLARGGLGWIAALSPPPARVAVPLLALGTLGLTWFGRVQAHHGHDLLLDEFLPWFQARIFLGGHLLAPIEAAWRDFGVAMQPMFMHVDEARGLWGSSYRPVHAALRALAMAAGADALLNPLLAAGSVLLVAHLARRILPDRPGAPLLAAALLAASAQFVGMTASGMSFSAHLFFALLWLALFLRGDLGGHVAAAVVGVLAMGLHQVHVHIVFAAPFLLAHLLGRYGRSVASLLVYAVAYTLALAVWIAWPEIATWIETGDAGALPRTPWETAYLSGYGRFALQMGPHWGLAVASEMPVNMLRFAAWLSPALLMLAILGHARFRALPPTVRLLAASFWLMVLAHAVLMPIQMHGWGYRYLHPVLGNLVLVAVAAFPRAGLDPPALRQAAIGATTALLALSAALLPWRLIQIEAEIRPRAAAEALVASRPADIVVLTTLPVWFGVDLVRNDPYLGNRPLVMAAEALDAATLATLRARFRVVEMGPAELAAVGIGRGDWIEPAVRPHPVRMPGGRTN